jgi:hypothetical protein
MFAAFGHGCAGELPAPSQDPIRAIVVIFLTLLSSSLAAGASAMAATSFAAFAASPTICHPSKLFLHLTNLLTSPVFAGRRCVAASELFFL